LQAGMGYFEKHYFAEGRGFSPLEKQSLE